MKIHNIKLHEQFCDPVAMGIKTFEVRRNDRGYQAGDYIRFTSVDDVLNRVHHPIDKEIFKITYVLSGWGIENGFVVLGIKKQENWREHAVPKDARPDCSELDNYNWHNEMLNG